MLSWPNPKAVGSSVGDREAMRLLAQEKIQNEKQPRLVNAWSSTMEELYR
jgi:hypothetical protein